MADLKISQLAALAGANLATADELAIVDSSASETKRITVTDLVGNATTLIADATIPGAKIVFSANLQETLSISAYEGAIVDTFPLVPDRLSYTEMYPEEFKYPSEWTDTWENYIKNKDKLIERIRHIMKQNTSAQLQLEKLTDSLTKNFFSSGEMINTIKSHGK